jgi:protein-tyrosine phosphatase
MKILMICLGNICRSPLAEGILKDKVAKHKLDWQIDSAGTGGWHVGELPDSRSIAVARKYQIDLTDQRARQFRKTDFDNFDLILAMDKSNFRNILKMAQTDEQRAKIHLILNFSRPESDGEVPDPYYDNRFDVVYEMLDEACEAVISNFKFQIPDFKSQS